MGVRLHRPQRVKDITSGWGWLGLLRLGLALSMGVYTLSYRPVPGHPPPPAVSPTALGLAALVFALGVAQLLPRLRASRAFAVAAFSVDAGAVLATLALFAFDPRRYLLALVIVIQAEGGVALGLLGGFLAWAVTSAGYVAVEALSASTAGAPTYSIEVAIRIAVGLLLALGGGYLATELSGERSRRLAEREEEVRRLTEAEAKYRVLVEQIPVITYIDAIDRESSTIYISPQVQEVLGYSPEEWTEDHGLWAKLLHEGDRERVIAENTRTNATGEPFRAEYRLKARDGGVVWLRDEALLVTDEAGRPRFWQGVMVDITDRKRAEEQVAFLAYHDKLTGLPNRAMFEQLLDLALARARRFDLAVAVLFYVSFWLIARLEQRRWLEFLKARVWTAASVGSVGTLALIGFTSVYREGFETALFFQALTTFGAGLGVWVAAGAATGAVALAAVAFAIFRYGRKLPIRTFLSIAVVIVMATSVAFIGNAVTSLQEAAVLDFHRLGGWPRLPIFLAQTTGYHPTTENVLAQASLAAIYGLGALYMFVIRPRRDRKAQVAGREGGGHEAILEAPVVAAHH